MFFAGECEPAVVLQGQMSQLQIPQGAGSFPEPQWLRVPQAVRSVKGILNKLTPEKFERLLNQLLEVITTAEILQKTIALVFENAVEQPTYVAMYGELCVSLSKELPHFPPPLGSDKAITFRQILLNTCQDEFESAADGREVRTGRQLPHSAPRRSAAWASSGPAGVAECCTHRSAGVAECCTHRRCAPAHYPPWRCAASLASRQALASVSDTAEREESEKRVKKRVLGNMRLMSELYKNEMVKDGIMVTVIDELLTPRNAKGVKVPPEDAIEVRPAVPQAQGRSCSTAHPVLLMVRGCAFKLGPREGCRHRPPAFRARRRCWRS